MFEEINNSRNVVYTDPYQEIFTIEKSNKKYYVRNAGIRVGIIVYNKQNILLVKQYRLIPDKFVWEIPGGGLNEFEEPMDAAKRELYEETGIVDKKLKKYFFFQPGLDANYNPTYLFESKKINSFRQLKNDEISSMQIFSSSEVLDMIDTKKITDAMTILAFYHGIINNVFKT